MSSHPMRESHLIARVGWLRAAVLGANDGLISTSSLIVGVASASPDRQSILIAGLAGLAAGAMAMAAGEYVSVSSQADTEAADLAKESRELRDFPAAELAELTAIWQSRGLEPTLAAEVAKQLTAHGALETHLRDELGMTEISAANPVQAAVTSAICFSSGALLPLLVAMAVPANQAGPVVSAASVVLLAALGALSARVGGAPILRSMLRVTFWGAMAMAVTAAVGAVFGTVV